MPRSELIAVIKSRLGVSLISAEAAKNDDIMLVIDRRDLVTAVGTLKNDPVLGFATLMNHLGADYGDMMAVIYNLYSPVHKRKITIKVYLDRGRPEVHSLDRAFPGIGWYERETFDLLGIRFIGHSNMKRLLLPDDWEGHPLRKDYVYPEIYNGVETGRRDVLDDAEEGHV